MKQPLRPKTALPLPFNDLDKLTDDELFLLRNQLNDVLLGTDFPSPEFDKVQIYKDMGDNEIGKRLGFPK